MKYVINNDSKLKAKRQGELDCLCGVYSIINATRYLYGSTSKQLFFDILLHLSERNQLYDVVTNGLYINDIGSILKHVVTPQFPTIKRSKPFYFNPNADLTTFWLKSQAFLNNHQGVVLLGLGGKHDHWTISTNITDKLIYLYDSGDLSWISKKYCSTDEGIAKTHIIYPTLTYFLWIES
jgi:hypothetical protein